MVYLTGLSILPRQHVDFVLDSFHMNECFSSNHQWVDHDFPHGSMVTQDHGMEMNGVYS